MSDNEKKNKISILNLIFPQDDLHHLSEEDILSSKFLQGILCLMDPEEFYPDDRSSDMNEYVHILYQIKEFLNKRNFNVRNYSRSLKDRIEIRTENTSELWEIVHLVILISFLCKDKQESLISQGLDFGLSNETMIKPSFIKGLLHTLNQTLSKLGFYDDEEMFEEEKQLSKSFVQANTELIEMRKSFAAENYNSPRKSTYETEYDESPFEVNENYPDESSVIHEIDGKSEFWLRNPNDNV